MTGQREERALVGVEQNPTGALVVGSVVTGAGALAGYLVTRRASGALIGGALALGIGYAIGRSGLLPGFGR